MLNNKSLIIAEIGVNHNGSLVIARKLILAAKKIGADYVKFQCYKTENIVHKKSDLAEYQKKTNLKFVNQFEMLKHLELSHKKILSLFKFSKKIKLVSYVLSLI